MSSPISTNLDDDVAQRAREIAQREHRSLSNLVANAVAVFTDLPKELRDTLLELRTMNDGADLRALARDMSALAARARLEVATRRLVDEGRFSASLREASDLDLLEAGTAAAQAVSRRRG